MDGRTYIGVACLICGESIKLSENEELAVRHNHYIFKVCDKCKRAVLSIRKAEEEKHQCTYKEHGWCDKCASADFCDIRKEEKSES